VVAILVTIGVAAGSAPALAGTGHRGREASATQVTVTYRGSGVQTLDQYLRTLTDCGSADGTSIMEFTNKAHTNFSFRSTWHFSSPGGLAFLPSRDLYGTSAVSGRATRKTTTSISPCPGGEPVPEQRESCARRFAVGPTTPEMIVDGGWARLDALPASGFGYRKNCYGVEQQTLVAKLPLQRLLDDTIPGDGIPGRGATRTFPVSDGELKGPLDLSCAVAQPGQVANRCDEKLKPSRLAVTVTVSPRP